MAELSNLRATLRRQSTPGSLVLLLCAALVFGPRAWDTMRGEPWIDNRIHVTSTGRDVVVSSETRTNAEVSGQRITSVEISDGTTICITTHIGMWSGIATRAWRLRAFTGCDQPAEPYRICSRYSLMSPSGRRKSYGPFCSPMADPVALAPS